MLRVAAAVILLAGGPAQAGVIYHFKTVGEGPHGTATASGRVWTEGNQYRVELDPSVAPRQYDIAISHDADVTATLISRSRNTIFDRPAHTAARSSLLFHLPMQGAIVSGKPYIRHRLMGTEMIAGRQTSKHVVEIEYKLIARWSGSPVRGKIKATASLWTTEELPALPFRRAVLTGYAHVDRELAGVFEKIRGMTLRHELRVSRTLEKGPTQTETVTTEIDELEVADIPEEMFEVPKEFR